jgi:hypothetical protein
VQFGRQGPEYTAQRLSRQGRGFGLSFHHLNCSTNGTKSIVMMTIVIVVISADYHTNVQY